MSRGECPGEYVWQHIRSTTPRTLRPMRIVTAITLGCPGRSSRGLVVMLIRCSVPLIPKRLRGILLPSVLVLLAKSGWNRSRSAWVQTTLGRSGKTHCRLLLRPSSSSIRSSGRRPNATYSSRSCAGFIPRRAWQIWSGSSVVRAASSRLKALRSHSIWGASQVAEGCGEVPAASVTSVAVTLLDGGLVVRSCWAPGGASPMHRGAAGGASAAKLLMAAPRPPPAG